MVKLLYYARIICEISLLPSIALSVLIYRRSAGRDLMGRLMAASVPSLLLSLGLCILLGSTGRPFHDWDAVRLSPVFAFWHGYPLYPRPTTGPLLSFCYGPVTALVYLPAVVAHTPTSAVLAAALITVFLMLAPVFWVHWHPHHLVRCRAIDGVMGFLAFSGFAFVSPALSYSLFSPAHDAVALGLGAIATGVLYRQERNARSPALMCSAFLAMLSIWAKQTMVPVVIALPL